MYIYVFMYIYMYMRILACFFLAPCLWPRSQVHAQFAVLLRHGTDHSHPVCFSSWRALALLAPCDGHVPASSSVAVHQFAALASLRK